MKTEEKTSVGAVAQIVFRPSAERRGYYLCHYGHLASDGTFAEASELSFLKFLDVIGIPVESLTFFMENFSDSELEICGFGYLSQERFDEFLRYYAVLCDAVQLYPGMLVLTFNKKKENEG